MRDSWTRCLMPTVLTSKFSRGCGGGTPPLSSECVAVSSSQANQAGGVGAARPHCRPSASLYPTPKQTKQGCGGDTPPLSSECTIVWVWPWKVRSTDCHHGCVCVGGRGKWLSYHAAHKIRNLPKNRTLDFHGSHRTARTPRRPHAPAGLILVFLFKTTNRSYSLSRSWILVSCRLIGITPVSYSNR